MQMKRNRKRRTLSTTKKKRKTQRNIRLGFLILGIVPVSYTHLDVYKRQVYETTSVKIAAGKYRFNVATSKIAFEGFRLIYTEAGEEKDEKGVLLKGLDENSELSLEQFDSKQHFTQPPAHYTEASLVKTLEELGIGRPSTYAPTITLIINRRYVAKEDVYKRQSQKRLHRSLTVSESA